MGTSSSVISKYFRMLSFSMFLRETLDAPAPWAWRTDTDRWIATFALGELAYEIEISPGSSDENQGGAWDVAFSLKYPDPHYPSRTFFPGPSITAFHVTGTGKAYTVFATIIDILKKFVESVEPDSLTFNASEPSRQKLYTRLVKMASTINPNYTYGTDRRSNFWIMRKENT